ncbi:MAG: tyrosine-type recombinase/integrase [Psychrilyobacter sp.]|nr:tyrosine-type recombinase/integrase [Psychrilyobacter sp.]
MSIDQIKELRQKLKENKNDVVITMLLEDKIKELEKKIKKGAKKRVVNRDIKYLTNEEYDKLMGSFEIAKDLYLEDKKKQLFKFFNRDKLIFLVAYECGLRASEVSNLRKEDFHEKSKEIFCRRLKGSRNNTVRLTKSTSKLLGEFIRDDNNSKYIFLSRKSTPLSRQHLTRICKKYFSLVDIPREKQHFHTLKHTAGVHLADLGLDIKEVQYILGHRNVENTMIYFDFTSKQQEVLYSKLGRN